MKRKVFLGLIMFCGFMLLSSFALLETRKANTNQQDKILLSRQGGTTRSADIVIDGSTDGRTNVTVTVENFTGTAIVQIVGGRTSAQYYFVVNESGYEVIDISGLRAATYTLRVIVGDAVYEGKLVKAPFGR